MDLDQPLDLSNHHSRIQKANDLTNLTNKITIEKDEKFTANKFVVDSLFKTIREFERIVIDQKRTVNMWKLRAQRSEVELKKLKTSVGRFFGKDQMNSMMGKKIKWSNATLRKSFILRYKLGKNFYDTTYRKKYAPHPSATLLNNRLKNYQISPGILKDNIKVLAAKIKSLPPHQRSFSLLLDDKAIMPSVQLNSSTKVYEGKCTLLPSKTIREKEGDDAVATNALTVLAVGTDVRFKAVVGLHYTASCTDGDALRKFIISVVVEVEKIAGAFVDSLGFDLGPSNQSMLKSMGVNLTAENEQYSIPHPNRSNAYLYLKPDDTHSKKNIISAIRKNDIKISSCLVERENLMSNNATFADVKKIYNFQKKRDLKIAKNLKYEIIKPSTFEVMKENTADQVHSIDVIAAIEYFDKKAAERGKCNATAFFLKSIHKFHTIITDRRGWRLETVAEREKYESDIKYLKYFIDDFIPNVKFSSKLKCINGVKMSIRCLIDLSELHFNRGCENVIPAYFLTDAIENLFSLVTNIFKKPNIKTFSYALRIISLNQFEYSPIKGNCSWDDTEMDNVDFFEMLMNEATQDCSKDDEEDSFPEFDILIEDEVTNQMIFKDDYDRHVFYCEMVNVLSKILIFLKCNMCKENLTTGGDEISANELFCLKEENSHTPKSYQPSHSLWKFFMLLEFVFKRLCEIKKPDDKHFREIFMSSASKILVPNEHCYKTTTTIISSFIKERQKMQFHEYMPHKRLQYASKSLK